MPRVYVRRGERVAVVIVVIVVVVLVVVVLVKMHALSVCRA